MAPSVPGANSTSIRVQLSKAQIALIQPGLDFVLRAYQTQQIAGQALTAYPFRMYPLPRGFDSGEFSQAMMDRISRLRMKLQRKAQLGGRSEVDAFELRAAAFAVRITLKLQRIRVRKTRKSMETTEQHFNYEKGELEKQAARKRRVTRYLEQLMKRANRRFMRAATPGAFQALSEEWRLHLRWMQFNLTYFKPIASHTTSLRLWYQNEINRLVRMAERAISDRRLQLPSEKSLRYAIRQFLSSSRRGRIGRYDHVYILKNSDSPFARTKLFEFLEPRLYLRRAS
jgi:hypothetical protein